VRWDIGHSLAVFMEMLFIHEFVDYPEDTGLGDIECKLSLIAEANKEFKDSKNALEWCLRQK